MSRCALGGILLASASLLGGAACSPTIRYPRWNAPGPAPYQRYVATQYDPYPQGDVGPEIVGGRPREYSKPPNEVARARQYSARGATSPAAANPAVATPAATLPPLAAPAAPADAPPYAPAYAPPYAPAAGGMLPAAPGSLGPPAGMVPRY
jgi:hypothetical protein